LLKNSPYAQKAGRRGLFLKALKRPGGALGARCLHGSSG